MGLILIHPSLALRTLVCVGWINLDDSMHFVATISPSLAAATSRKQHGTAGDFDVDLPLAGDNAFHVRILLGDVDGNGTTNILDLSVTKGNLFKTAPCP